MDKIEYRVGNPHILVDVRPNYTYYAGVHRHSRVSTTSFFCSLVREDARLGVVPLSSRAVNDDLLARYTLLQSERPLACFRARSLVTAYNHDLNYL